jgi:hypothetical protein
MNYESDSSDDN